MNGNLAIFGKCPCFHSMFKEINGEPKKFDIMYARSDTSLQKSITEIIQAAKVKT